MQGMRCMSMRERVSEVTQVIAGIVLFILLTGLWACLWVPSPIF
jgi:hypothetical protein